jgi:hypothetical protein
MAVIEIQTLRLTDTAGPDQFVQADQRLQVEFAYQQPGLLRRTTARAGSGREWLVVTIWVSAQAADAADSAARDHRAVDVLAALVDPTSVVTRRYETLD